MERKFSFDEFLTAPRDPTPTITAFARALCARAPVPTEWYVDAITMATIRDEGKLVGHPRADEYEIVQICGVRIREFEQPT